MKFKIGYNARISKYTNAFAKRYTTNCSENVFVIKKFNNTIPGTYLGELYYCIIGEKLVGTFYENELQKII